jgi:hypothetical protein
LIADLDSPSFKARSQAARELREVGDAVSPALRSAAKETRALESLRRLRRFSKRSPPSPSRLRTVEQSRYWNTSAQRKPARRCKRWHAAWPERC